MERIVVVDDHRPFLDAASRALRREGWAVTALDDGGAVTATVAEVQPEVVLVDVQLGATSGFDVAAELSAHPGGPTVILISARAASDYGDEVERSGAHGFIDKAAFSPGCLRDVLDAARP